MENDGQFENAVPERHPILKLVLVGLVLQVFSVAIFMFAMWASGWAL